MADSFNVGERVKWRWRESNADPSELVGTVQELIIQYRVKFDSGEIETCDEDDLIFENEETETL